MKKKACLILLVTICFLGNIIPAYSQSGLFDRTGAFSEHGIHGSMPFEHIDLFTGNLKLSFLDVYLPGPNGLDIRVWRIYNSKILKDRQTGQSASVQAYHQSWVGIGWTMHMGMVHSYSSNNPVIEFPDGRLETAFSDINNPGKYITRDFLRYDKGTSPSYIPKLYFMNGEVWTFGTTRTITRADGTIDQVRLVTRIENAYGHHISISYNLISPTISSITDCMGRVVTFISSGTPRKLNQIKIQVNSTTYRVINYSVGTFPNGYTKLNSITIPLLPATSFVYENGSSDKYELKTYNSPYGGHIDYAYSNHVFYFNGIWLDSRVLIRKSITFNSGEEEKAWNYSYPDYNGVPTGTVHIDGPEYDTDITFNGYDSASPWLIGTIHTFQRGNGILIETYEWASQQVSNNSWSILNTNMGPARGIIPDSFKRFHTGEASTKVEYLYERPNTSRYGQPTRVNYYINESLTPLHYSCLSYYHENHQSFIDRYLIELLSAKTEYSSGGIKLKEFENQYYEEDTKWGALLKATIMKTDSESLSWDHTYSSSTPSLITTTVDPPGSSAIVTSKYKYGALAERNYPNRTINYRTISQYDSSITSERQAENVEPTHFYYDVLGSILRVDLPTPMNDITYDWLRGGENIIAVKQGKT